MAFWKNSRVAPKRQFRFKIHGTDVWWWAKSIDKPTVNVSSNPYRLINHQFNFPGIVTWQPVMITVVDDSVQTNKIYNYLTNSGYNKPNSSTVADGVKKNGFDGAGNDIEFFQLDDEGGKLEAWRLKNSIVTSVNFGKLDYSSDDLVELSIEITYDFAELEKGNNTENNRELTRAGQEQKNLKATNVIADPQAGASNNAVDETGITNNNIDPTSPGSPRSQADKSGRGTYEKLP